MFGSNSPYSEAQQEYLEALRGPGTINDVTRQAIEHGLATLQQVQSVVSAPGLPADESPIALLRTYVLALFVELGEFINETPWKPWRKKTVHYEDAGEEFADILAFLGVILLLLPEVFPELTPQRLAAMYIDKSILNAYRIGANYGTNRDTGKAGLPADANPHKE
jgi:hypothetical protein